MLPGKGTVEDRQLKTVVLNKESILFCSSWVSFPDSEFINFWKELKPPWVHVLKLLAMGNQLR